MLKINSVSVKFGSATILSNVSFQVSQNNCVSIIGANGAGKTTLLKAISGVVECNTGNIEFRGENITGKRPDEIIKMGIAHCPEGRRIFPAMTVRENMEIGGFVNRKEIPANIEKCCEMFPRLGERLNQYAGTMSGGEQQMLAMGRALMTRPKLILLDEPSMGLAPLLVDEIFNMIQTVNDAGTTVLLVEQNANKALHIANRAYVLETGYIKLSGNARDLLVNPEVQQAYLGG